MKRTSILVALALLTSPARSLGQAPTDAFIEAGVVQQSSTAEKRNSNGVLDPWATSSPTALFSRPSLTEAVKLSLNRVEGGEEYSATVGSAILPLSKPWWLDGVQAIGSINPTTEAFSLAAKYNLSFRDIRSVARSVISVEASPIDQAEQECVGVALGKIRRDSSPEARTEAEMKALKTCAAASDPKIDSAITKLTRRRPAFAAGGRGLMERATGPIGQ